jgi:hypothetical protein
MEIQLLHFFEKREREKKELKERQRQQHLQMSQTFNTITEVYSPYLFLIEIFLIIQIDSTRTEVPKQKELPAQVSSDRPNCRSLCFWIRRCMRRKEN